ncbi:Glutamate--tRNA ligase [Urinicoccus massiliensis]|uniref:Glutamate--tRNA ligase n=1 Tax=Urinicoccus massiliensis TaxID=1723382 RepID=A0A8H2M6I4_9FIRM|nr:glutamate--tRNA ligase [Urinicoccus massiliensis]VFB16981.1 Glutamate--tRNA ligase [Urinicoccus massiliensis]
MTEVRLRFAPSPTGYLHIGGLRTALYNYLFAKANHGKMVLRIEDTDRTRFVEGAIEGLIQSLKWAGIDYDEGVFMEDGKIVERGDYGPYIQSERLDIYQKYVDQLLEEGHAYYCFCSKDRLDHLREEQKIKGQIPRYDGLCRSVPLDEARERIAKGEKAVVRLKLPENMDIKFHDAVRGDITINTNEMDDQVLMKSDGFPTYHMAVVVDDHLMKITHIVRGEEWLPSTPKHIYLYDCFGWEKPQYVHLPGVLNADHKKLSKRQGDVSVEDFKNRGYLPEGLINYLALVGWSPKDNEEILSMKDLIDQFSFDRVSKAGGVFDKNKLDWVNAHYIKELPIDDLVDLSIPELVKAGLISQDFAQGHRDWLKLLLETVRESLSRIEEVPEKTAFLFGNLEVTEEEAKDQLASDQIGDLLGALKEELDSVDQVDQEFAKTVMKRIQKKTGIKGKGLYMPTRAALTGNVHGPELSNIMELLGKDKMLERIEQVLNK